MKTITKLIMLALTGILLNIAFGTLNSFAQTNVGGIIDTDSTWTLAGSPYIVTGQNIIVDAGVTLTIEPGVTVKFDTTRSMQIDGTLRAIGTASKPITFTTNTAYPKAGCWGFILFNSNSTTYNFTNNTGSTLQHCLIEYAGATSAANGALRLDNASPYLKNCSIKNNSKPGIYAYNYAKTLMVDSCTIQNNTGNGIDVTGKNTTATAIINGCTIINNTSSGYYGFNLNNTIKNCRINNNNKGVFIKDTLLASINFKDTIRNSTINTNSGYGISYSSYSFYPPPFSSLNSSTCSISNNSISSNNSYGISYSSSYYASNSSTCSITNNSITNNSGYGISYASSPNSNSNSSTCSISNNSISGNSGYGISYSSFTPHSSTCSISNNSITDNSGYGISYSSSVDDSYNSSTCSISNNSIIGNSGYGIFYSSNYYYSNSSTCSISNNSIIGNSGYGIFYSSAAFYSSATNSSTCSISNNSISGNSGYGISYSAPYASNSSTCSISNNSITGNSGYGISYSSSAYSNSILSTCSISNNSINNNYNGIYVLGANTMNINKNKIINNHSTTNGGGIYITTARNISIIQNIISGNRTTQEGGGVYMNVNEASNVFSNNAVVNNYAPNSSAFYYQGSGVLKANNNTIVWNKTKDAGATRAVYLGSSKQNTQITLQNNNIYNSSCNNSPFYELYAGIANSDSINALNTYWKQTTTNGVSNVIFEYLDSSQLGRVLFKPFLTLPDTSAPITPVQNVTKTDLGGGKVQITWAANTETDIAGYKIYWGKPTGYSFDSVKNVGNVTTYTLSGVSITDTIEVTAYDTQASGTDAQVLGHESWFQGGNDVFAPVANAGTAKTICNGDSVTIGTTAVLGTTYSWSPATGVSSAIVSNPTVKATVTTTYTVSATTACGTASASVVVTVNTLPNTPTVTQNGNTLMSSATTGNQWYLNGNIISSATTQSYTPTQNGSYTVIVTVSGCSAASVAFNYVGVGIEEIAINNRISISPNPTNGKFTITMEDVRMVDVKLAVYNVLGERVYQSVISHWSLANTIDISNQPAGIYFLQVNTGEEIINGKLVLEK